LKISVVIPAWNAEGTLKSCLRSVKEQTRQPDQVIVVDDSSSDSTVSIAVEFGAEVIRCMNRSGPALTRNLGAEAAEGDVIVFLDSDVTTPKGLLARIETILNQRSDAAAVQTVYTASCPADNIVSRYQNFYYHFALAHVREEEVAIFATWCAAIRRSDFESVGGFNTRIPEPTVEDEELGYSLADAGRSIYLAKDLEVTHLAGYTLTQFIRRRLRMAMAQSKSGWRSFRERLLKRYINVRETGTHHSRWVVLSILLTLGSVASLLLSLLLLGAALQFIAASVALLLFSTLCHTPFLRKAVRTFGWRVLPSFILLGFLDMIVLGCGIVTGTVQYLFGRRY